MSAEYISRTYYDTNLFSGSDPFRDAFGDYITIETADDGSAYAKTQILSEDIYQSSVIDTIYESPYNLITTASGEAIFESLVTAVSIRGKSTIGGLTVDNEAWHAAVFGGTIDDKKYPPLVTEGVHEIYYMKKDQSYDLLRAKTIANSTDIIYNTHAHKSVYNYSSHLYERSTGTSTAMGAIPNVYLMASTIGNSDYMPALGYDSVNKFFFYGSLAYLTGTYDPSTPPSPIGTTGPAAAFGAETVKLLPIEALKTDSSYVSEERFYEDRYLNTKEYLTGLYNNENTDQHLQASYYGYNVVFTKAAVNNIFPIAHQISTERLPYYNKIQLPVHPTGQVTEELVKSNLHDLLMKHIADQFTTSADSGGLTLSTVDFSTQTEQDNSLKQVERTTTNQKLKSVQLQDFLSSVSNTGLAPMGLSEQSYHVLGTQLASDEACRSSGDLRYINKIAADDAIGRIRVLLDSSLMYTPWSVVDTDKLISKELMSNMGAHIPTDITAFRIEKINTITNQTQNIVIPNQLPGSTADGINPSAAPSCWNYYDSQISYGGSYEYNIYAYVISVGFKYEYSDIVASRTITAGHDTTDGYECIEFYSGDVASGEAQSSPMDIQQINELSLTMKNATAAERVPISAKSISGIDYFTSAQELSYVLGGSPYYADFKLTITPNIRIIECPLNSKSLTLIDSPPPSVEVIPFQIKDDSQKIGFYLKTETHRNDPYPLVFTEEELLDKAKYFTSKNLLDNEPVTAPSVSQPRFLEVYRMSKEPNGLADFHRHRVAVKDLLIEDYKASPISVEDTVMVSTSCIHEEVISLNHKFYYLFRLINEKGIPGPWSPVQIIQLIDDGGYKYIKVDTMNVKDLEKTERASNPVEAYKKIMQFIPEAKHLVVDDSGVDYDQAAYTQVENLKVGQNAADSIWDKTFKIRMTSKKTGKKIDINVTYRLKTTGGSTT